HGDLFHEAVPDDWIDRVFAVMALAPQHTFQILTKRPARARQYLAEGEARLLAWYRRHLQGRVRNDRNDSPIIRRAVDLDGFLEEAPGVHIVPIIERRHLRAGWPLPNVWLGTSVSD